MIRLVATDLDGTFWDPQMVVPAAHAEAVQQLDSRGITVLAATSRRPRTVRASLAAAGLALPAVLVDGAIGIDFRTDERFHQAVFDPTVAAAVLGAFREVGLDPCVYIDHPDFDILVSDNPATCAGHLANIAAVTRVEDLDTGIATRPVYAFSLLGLPRAPLDQVSRLLVDHRVETVLFAEPVHGEYGLTVNPPGVSKWSGILAFCRLAGIVPNEVLAVGDGDNDIAMLAGAGTAVGVKGGTTGVLAAADHLIDPPHELGWATLLDLIGL